METINFEDLQWTPPSSPQHEEGVTLQLPSLDRAEEISSILLECPPIETPPLHNVTPSHDTAVIKFFNDDPMIPIYGSHVRSLDTKMVVEYVGSGIEAAKAAKIVPSRPRGNFMFMYDSNYLENWKDVLSDDFGVWRPNGTKTLFFLSEIKGSGKMKAKHVPKEEADLRAKRYLYAHPTTPTFKRVVVKTEMRMKDSQTDDPWKLLKHIFVQYYFEDGVVKEVAVSPHGNSKKGTCFLLTLFPTLV